MFVVVGFVPRVFDVIAGPRNFKSSRGQYDDHEFDDPRRWSDHLGLAGRRAGVSRRCPHFRPQCPGPGTRYTKSKRVRFALTFSVRTDLVAQEARYDGTFPLITNDATMTPAAALLAYKYQPNLERRNHQLKGHQLVAPVYLKDPVRIEGLLCCHFFALLVQALIEREIRNAMKSAGTTSIPLYPELRDCSAPSAERVLEIFAGVSRHVLHDGDGEVLKVFEPTLDRLQLQVLELLGISPVVYT